MRRGRRIAGTGFASATAGLACALSVSLATRPINTEPAARQPPFKLIVVPADIREPQHPETEIAVRPLFSPSRRPYVPPPAAVGPVPETAPPPSVEPLTLAGVLIDGGQRLALLTAPSFPEGQWIAVGSAIGGYRLDAVEAGAATLSNDGARTSLQLYVDSGSAGPAE